MSGGKHSRRASAEPRVQLSAASRLARWTAKPRYPLDWQYNSRGLLLVLILLFGLLWGGFAALTGLDRRGNPVLGFLALMGGLALTLAVLLYLRRPTVPRPPSPTLREDLVSFLVWCRRR